MMVKNIHTYTHKHKSEREIERGKATSGYRPARQDRQERERKRSIIGRIREKYGGSF